MNWWDDQYVLLNDGNGKLRIEDYPGALKIFTRVLELDPKFSYAFFARGFSNYKLGINQDAIEDFTKAIELEVNGAYYYRGLVKKELKDYQSAIEDFTKAIEFDKKTFIFSSRSSRGLLKMKLGDQHAAIEDFTKAIALDPSEIRFKDCKELRTLILKINFNNLNYKKNKIQKIFLTLGRSFIYSNQFKKAVSQFTKVIEINPKNKDAFYQMGLVKEGCNDYHGAIADYTKVIEINPKNKDAFIDRGLVKEKINDNQGAIADYTKVIEINPKNKHAFILRGFVKEKINDYQGAIADYTKVIEINPKNKDAFIWRGSVKEKINDYQGAITDYTRVIGKNPSDLNLLMKRVLLREKLKDYNGLVDDYLIIIKKNLSEDDKVEKSYLLKADEFIEYSKFLSHETKKNFELTLFDLGKHLYKSNFYHESISVFSKVIQINPKSIDSLLSRGLSKETLGDFKSANDDYLKAIEINPNNKIAEKKLSKIQDKLKFKRKRFINDDGSYKTLVSHPNEKLTLGSRNFKRLEYPKNYVYQRHKDDNYKWTYKSNPTLKGYKKAEKENQYYGGRQVYSKNSDFIGKFFSIFILMMIIIYFLKTVQN